MVDGGLGFIRIILKALGAFAGNKTLTTKDRISWYYLHVLRGSLDAVAGQEIAG